MTATVVDLSAFRAHREADMATELAKYDTLGCPRCDKPAAPHHVTHEPVVSYRCDGVVDGVRMHRTLDWRIDESGEMLTGRKGRRYAK